MLNRYPIFFVMLSALQAQQVVAPTTEPVGIPRGDNVGQYNVTQSFETGYRWSAVGGNLGMYKTVVNYGNGIRLLSGNLAVHSLEGHGRYFDEILINTLGLGNDPYQAAVLRIQKNRLYRYDFSWRLNDYFTPGLAVAAGTHFFNTSRRLQDHDLTLLPQSRFRFRVGYSRVKEDGPALTTAQEFNDNGFGFPVFTDVRRDWNEYRVGFDANVRGFQFTLTHRWDYFKDDSPLRLDRVVGTGTPTDQTRIEEFVRAEPLHGANPGWLGNLFTRRKLWGLNVRATYVGGRRDFLLNEISSGIGQFGSPASRQIVVSGRAQRPVFAGDFTLTAYPSEKLTIVYNTSVLNNRIDGDSTFTEFNTGLNLGTTVNFRFLGVRLVTNATDVNYQLRPWIGLYGGFHYSDRLIRTVESFSLPDFPDAGETQRFAVGNTLRTFVAGSWLRPWKPVTVNLEAEIGRGSLPLTPTAERDYHLLNGRVDYRTRRLRLSAIYKQNYNVNNTSIVTSYSSRARNYSGNASWSPRDGFSLDGSYMKLHLDTRSSLSFFAGPVDGRPALQTAFPSLYFSNVHAAYLSVHFRPMRRVDLFVGYSLTKDTGDGRATAVPAGVTDPTEALLDAVQTFPLTYQSPLARISIRIREKLRWNAGWQYYGYDERFHVFGFNQNFRANTGYTSLLWSF